jgi:hypothetical protein
MNYNLHAGWGRAQTSGFPFRATGKIYLVASTSVANRGMIVDMFITDTEGKGRIYTTLDAAVSACTASAGDIIYMAPGHSESISSATALAIDVAGVRIIGLGEGDLRPTLTLDTATTATITVSTSDVTIENCIIDLTGIDAVAVGITVTGDDVTFRNCKIVVADSGGQATIGMKFTSTDNVLIENCDIQGSTDAGTTCAIDLVSGNRITIRNNFIYGAYTAATGAIRLVSGATGEIVKNLDISNNFIANTTSSSTVCISNSSSGCSTITGRIALNHMQIDTDGGASWVFSAATPTTQVFCDCSLFENYGVNNNGENGKLFGLNSFWFGQ